ncbi:F-box/kelch-repeat protein At3g06240-like [Primulina huaijiensis]|uniref:F-box/kelch-repeat protein At3g06240-like n=1 Tax=Primulina huaijiensis TaxID=1492673 RepID=UPI003CC74D0D
MVDPPLPTDMLIEVLIRLQVKSILKFRCVCKTWCDLIRSPVFIQGHQKRERKQKVLLVKRYLPSQNGDEEVFSFSHNSTVPGLRMRILSHSLPPRNGEGETFSFHDPDFPEVLVSPNLPIPILNDLNIPWYRRSDIPIHGPCNGLVCIAFEKTVFLCNPALREFKLLPPPRFPVGYIVRPFKYGFGFDPLTGAYKVIHISDMRKEHYEEFWYNLGMISIRIDMYNSATDSWKQIHDVKVPPGGYLPGYELFYNGAIHWAVIAPNTSSSILCFNVSTDTFRQIDFHDNFSPLERDLKLMELNDSLSVVRYSNLMTGQCNTEIWVMKEYGVKESWTKQFVIGPYCVICPFLFLKNELLLVESANGQLATCALHENQFKGFQFYGSRRSTSAVLYEESLINLNQIIASDRRDE